MSSDTSGLGADLAQRMAQRRAERDAADAAEGRTSANQCAHGQLARECEALSALAASELERARRLHGPMASAHEGYAVILEEVDELWEEVRKKHPDKQRMREEAIQIAAMALRFVHDVVKP